jgi:hypothetical protein
MSCDIIKGTKEGSSLHMEILLVIIAVTFVLLVICASVASANKRRRYGYVSLPTGITVEGWVEYYEPEANGMANVRIKGRTYYVHCSKITLIEK